MDRAAPRLRSGSSITGERDHSSAAASMEVSEGEKTNVQLARYPTMSRPAATSTSASHSPGETCSGVSQSFSHTPSAL